VSGAGGASLRLVIAISSFRAGGAERVAATLANSWSDRHEVTAVTLDRPDGDFFELDPRVARVGLGLLDHGGGPLLGNVKRVKALRSTLRRLQPDAVVSFVERMNVIVLSSATRLGIPVVVSERTVPWQHDVGLLPTRLRRLLYPRAAAVVVQSPEVADWARRFVPHRRVHVIPNPVAATDRARAPEPIVVGLGRLSYEKGFDLLLRGFEQVAGQYSEWRVVIGGEGPERAALEQLAAGLGLDGRVEFPGVVDATELLARAGVFVLPSRFEGFPNALLEAMAMGVPSIASDCPTGPRHIVRDGVDALLIPDGQSEAIAVALRRLLGDSAERVRLGDTARAVVDRFGVDRIVGEWDAVVNAAVAEALVSSPPR
jgi:GalNAc-alpha-(1->4)-GalNAc-alpha-(1->3)-diNAcBac-PP-undecaprenol alpha-1,4-N-acetyl-D-galactosaminyltransferase